MNFTAPYSTGQNQIPYFQQDFQQVVDSEEEEDDEVLTQEYALNEDIEKAGITSLDQACEQDKEEIAISLLLSGTAIDENSPYLDKLLLWTCKRRMDESILKLIKYGADFNREECGKNSFDYYLDAGGNLANLLSKIKEDDRINLVLRFVECEDMAKVLPGDLMVALTIPQFREKIIFKPDLGFLTGNSLKVYAQVVRRENIFSRECEVEFHILLETLGKFSFDQQKDFFNFCTNEPFKKNVRTAFLKTHPELNDREEELESELEILTTNIGINETQDVISDNPEELIQLFTDINTSIFKRTLALSKLSQLIILDKNLITPGLILKVDEFRSSVNHLNLRINGLFDQVRYIQFWNPNARINSAHAAIKLLIDFLNKTSVSKGQVTISTPSLLSQIESVYRIIHSTTSIETTEGEKETNHVDEALEFKQLTAKWEILRMKLIELANEETVQGASFDWEHMLEFFFSDFVFEKTDDQTDVLTQYGAKLNEHVEAKLSKEEVKDFDSLLKLITPSKGDKREREDSKEKEIKSSKSSQNTSKRSRIK